MTLGTSPEPIMPHVPQPLDPRWESPFGWFVFCLVTSVTTVSWWDRGCPDLLTPFMIG